MKKELSRKKSFEAIPFKPKINNLSNQIVQQKKKIQAPRYQCAFRSAESREGSVSKTVQLTHKVYSRSKENDRFSQSK